MKHLFLCVLVTIVFPRFGYSDDVTLQIEQPVENAITILQTTQKNEENWRQLKEELTLQLEVLQAQVADLTRVRDSQIEEILTTQKRISAKEKQLADVLQIEQEMDPFLHRLVEELSLIPEEDLPFLQRERKDRIAKLRLILSDPAISMSERYRKTMEALQIEAEYGVTLETYQEMLDQEEEKILVNILRLGKLGLYYVTLDESSCGFYNVAENKWQRLADNYIYSLQTAVAIASRRRPAEIIEMPLGRVVR